MNLDRLAFYNSISQLPVPKTYPGKIMLVAFVGTHIPLIVLILNATISNSSPREIASTLIITFLATLIAAIVTLYALHHLLRPIILTSQALRQYLKSKRDRKSVV